MIRYTQRLYFLISLALLDLAAISLAFEAAYWVRFYWPPFLAEFPAVKGVPEIGLYHDALMPLLPVCLIVFNHAGFYKESLLSAYDELIQVMRGVAQCALLAMAMSFISYRGTEYSRLVVALWAFIGVAFVYLLREINKALFRFLHYRLAGPERVLVIGKGKLLDVIRDMAVHQPFAKATYLDHLPSHADLESLLSTTHISEVILLQGPIQSQSILATAQICERLGIPCKVVPDLLEMRRGEIIMDGFCGLPTFTIKSLSLYGTNYILKRSFDICLSLIILVFFSIPLVVIAVLIWFDSDGPVLFTQDRMGFHGKKFKLFKFRTMDVDADSHIDQLRHLSDRSGPVFKMKNDPRITRFGRVLRNFSLDELPQIINVLKGDMSLVGPRPQVLWEAAAYDEHAKRRLRIKPGITGLWQVSGRAALSYEEMINLDIFYLENWSLGLDLKILLRTIPAIFAKEGAY